MIFQVRLIILCWSCLILIGSFSTQISVGAQDRANLIITPDDAKISYSDYVHMEFATPVHPNDKGFAQMGERLATQMRQPSR